MSWALFMANIKSNRTIWIIMTCIFCFYLSFMVSMYDPNGLDAWEDMLSAMPEGFLRAVGWDFLGSTLLATLATTMYGFLLFMFPLVISIVVNHRIIASHVDRGSMAYLLATPNSRTKISLTQALFSMASMTVFFTVATIFGILVSQAMFPGELEVGRFVLLNLYALLVYFALGGIGFLASCVASESKFSLGFGLGIPAGFLILQMLGNASDNFYWIRNLTLLTLFDPAKLIDGDGFAYIAMAIFALLAAALYGGGIAIFNKRDMHV